MRKRSDAVVYDELAAMLSQDQMGDIASNHWAELNGFRGWNFVAINAVAKQAARAAVMVYDDAPLGYSAKAYRRERRAELGPEWRKSLSSEHSGSIVPAEHPLVQLLRQPNPKQTGAHFRWEQIIQLRLHGSSIVWNRPNQAGNRTVHRYVLPHGWITPIAPGSRPDMPSGGVKINPPTWGRVAYFTGISVGGFAGRELPVEQLSIARYPHPMIRSDGASPTTAADGWVDTHAMISEFRKRYYSEGPNGKVIVEIDSTIDMTPNQAREWSNLYSELFGPDGPPSVVMNAKHRLASNKTAEDLGFDESDLRMRDAIFSAHQISSAFVGNVEGMTYGSVAAALLAGIELSVQPDLDLLADEDTLDLAGEYEGLLSVEYEAARMIDPQMQQQQLQDAAGRGVMTVGEYRTRMGWPLTGAPSESWIMTAAGPVPPEKLGAIATRTASIPAPAQVQTSPTGSGRQAIGLSLSRGSVSKDGALAETIVSSLKSLNAEGYAVQPLGWPMEVDRITKALSAAGVVMADDVAAPELVWDQSIETFDEFEARRKPEPPLATGLVVLPLPPDVADRLASVADDLLDGQKPEPCIVLLRDVVGVPGDEVAAEVRKLQSVTIQFGCVRSLPATDEGVPLVIDVESTQAAALRRKLRECLPHSVDRRDDGLFIRLGFVSIASASKYGQPKPCDLSGMAYELRRAEVHLGNEPPISVPLRVPARAHFATSRS